MNINSKTWKLLSADQRLYLLELAATQNWMGRLLNVKKVRTT